MPVIVICSTKGGVGKSTIALVLAQVYAKAGSDVSLLDADPNQPLANWAKRFPENIPGRLNIIGDLNEDTIIDQIDSASEKSPFVIVDLEGSANLTASFAVSRADLVLIPMRGKQLDADQAGKVISLIERDKKAYNRDIEYRVVFSMMSALQSKEQRHIIQSFESKKIHTLPVFMEERAAFSAIFQLGGSIFDLRKEDVSNPVGAVKNAKNVAQAVVDILE